ncbi:MAG: thioredoxin domain-containing protein [Spirochaetaceae bacterium]|nr:thioredoxin domain-containing protein [Spirochaetaceae bacterium]
MIHQYLGPMDFLRNNLISASNPYLRQHKDNPVWWQEWNPQTLEYAREHDKPLLVSVGYSTCHWCHVMAQEAFSDPECAELLNREFVSIKIDREQRPDIDQYLMSFLVATTGSGGWPLNAFLTPDGHPFFAMTYASTEARFQTPAFPDILRQVREFYDERKGDIEPFEVAAGESPAARTEPVLAITDSSDDDELAGTVGELQGAFDRGFGGFGSSQKFPPHSTLLFMLYAAAGAGEDTGKALLAMATETLDAMMTRGMHDHLQGGFFRYCVDRNWTIPHFEKMLYDQAMLLWNYSLAGRLTRGSGYKTTAEGIFRSLEETFRIGDLYAAAHDADTDHHEGETYLWSLKEVTAALNEAERDALLRVYDVSQSGNFEGKNHLVRRLAPGYENDPRVPRHRRPDPAVLRSAEGKLLAIRGSRPQPFRDEKLLTGWNALVGCGLVAAHRYLGLPGTLHRALEIARSLLDGFMGDGRLGHAAINDTEQREEFLSDYASAALLLAMLGEETSEFAKEAGTLASAMLRFRRDGHWFESDNRDFRPIPAQAFDQPVPSGMALAQGVLLRREIGAHANTLPQAFTDPLAHGFQNVSALMSRGYFHVVESPEPVSWDRLPANTIQIRGRNDVSCYRGACHQGLPKNDRRKKSSQAS